MSSEPSSSKEAMAHNPRPPPQPLEKLKRDLQSRKVIFFTLDTLFNRNHAMECALERCRQINPDLGGKTLDELKRGYRDAMTAAYRRHIHTQLHGLAPVGCPPNSNPQALNDKVGMIFQQLNLTPPSVSERKLIGGEFAAAFSRNRLEVHGASHTLLQLKHLEYTIVVVDDALDWDVVKDLNFWQYIDAKIISEDLLVRKPDPRVFQKALDAYGVSPKHAVIVGCSIEEDVAGIMNTGAEPILYMPGCNRTVMDVRGTRVLVVRTMDEFLLEIKRRPENSHLVPVQQQQAPPVPHPIHPQMVYARQNPEHSNDQNDGPSSQSQNPPSDPKPVEDGHASQSRERTRFLPVLSQPGPSGETPRNHRLSDRDHSTRDYERNLRPVPPLSPVPSTQTYWPPSPQPARILERPNGDGSGRSCSTNSPPAYSPRSPSPPPMLPPMSQPTSRIGISRALHMRDMDMGLREIGPLRKADIHLHLDLLEVRINYPSQATSGTMIRDALSKITIGMRLRGTGTLRKVDIHQPQTAACIRIRDALGKAGTSMSMRLRGTGTLHKADIHLELQTRIKPPTPATPGIMSGSALEVLNATMRCTVGPWETGNAGPLRERWGPPNQRRPPCQEEHRVQPHHQEAIDLTSPKLAVASPDSPVDRLSDGNSSMTLPEDRDILHPQAVERHEARPSNQGRLCSIDEETATHCERCDEVSTTDNMSSTDRPTSQSSRSQSARPDDAVVGPSGQHQSLIQRASQELELAQSLVNLRRGRPRVNLSPISIDKVPERGEDQGRQ
ncbi:hypothetical protein FAGAP_512 [Fusarium agapanthi]|uniref:Uncharacterized protein n=1 Tax=Fusarium agapanthi TaxID=1803897 RepID=A0A9P5BJ15_9HYPO|nr:hypothetical protein FAGAP_512 [Fusarium agapanthi]